MPPPLPNPAMIGLLAFVGLVPVALASAQTAMDCLPPLPPNVAEAATRAEYRAEIAEEYSAYFDEAQTYLLCLEASRATVTDEINRAIVEYQALGLPPDN
ncbi:MAG: hypothetical protein ABI832_14785 [bacterium]